MSVYRTFAAQAQLLPRPCPASRGCPWCIGSPLYLEPEAPPDVATIVLHRPQPELEAPDLPPRWVRLWHSLVVSAVLAVALAAMGLACGRTPPKAKPRPEPHRPYRPPQHAFEGAPVRAYSCVMVWGVVVCWPQVQSAPPAAALVEVWV